MRPQRVPTAELAQLCGRCDHQNAAHTGGAKNYGWAIYDEVWTNARGWCQTPGCDCIARGVGELPAEEEARRRALRDATQPSAPAVDAPEVFTAPEDPEESPHVPEPVVASVATVASVAPETRSGFPVWRCPPSGHVNDMLRALCKQCGAHRPCEHWDGKRRCGATPVHMFIDGPRCKPHAPGALKTSSETSTRMENAA